MSNSLLPTESVVASEADIDRRLRDLMVRIIRRRATAADKRLYKELSLQRVELMRPAAVMRTRRLTKAA